MQALSSVGNFFKQGWGGGSGWLSKAIPAGLAGGGFLSNWLNNRKYNSRQDFMANLAKDPQKMQAYINQFRRPLNDGLVKGVGNQVQGYLGERGLSQSPTVSADVLAQALAPYQQQNDQTAIQTALKSLGLLDGPAPQNADVSGALAMLLKPQAKQTGTPTQSAGAGAPGLTFPTDPGNGTLNIDPSLLGYGGWGQDNDLLGALG